MEKGVTFVEFRGNERAEIDPEHHANKRAESYVLLSKKLANGGIAIRYDEEL